MMTIGGTTFDRKGMDPAAPGFVYSRTVDAAKWAPLLNRTIPAMAAPVPRSSDRIGVRTTIAVTNRLKPPPISR